MSKMENGRRGGRTTVTSYHSVFRNLVSGQCGHGLFPQLLTIVVRHYFLVYVPSVCACIIFKALVIPQSRAKLFQRKPLD